jgi:hypothetical protein
MKVWHRHIALARHGALEGTGTGTDEEELKELLTGLLDEQANLTAQQKKELLGDIESRKMLFWNGYERECGETTLVLCSIRRESRVEWESRTARVSLTLFLFRRCTSPCIRC